MPAKEASRRHIGMKHKNEEQKSYQFELIVENSIDAIISETLDGIVTSWNGGAVKMFGYSAKEAIGKSISFLFPPEMRDELSAMMNKIKAGKVIVDHDSVRVHKNGKRINIAFSSSLIKEDDKVIGISCIERDITERKKAEESMRQIQLIVDSSQDGIFGVSLDGIITSWNGGAAKMFGYSAKEVIGKSSLILFDAEKKKDLQMFIGKIKQRESVLNYDGAALRKNGSIVEVSLSISPILTKDNSVISASVVVRDITTRKKTERHIEELNEIRSKFIEIISHQLGTPLTAVNWNLETLLNGDFGKLKETQRKFLQATHYASVEIAHRIHNLLTAMDVEEGRVRYKTEEVDINNICSGVINEALRKCELKNIFCKYIPLAVNSAPIYGDGEKIRVAVDVLVGNAVAYTKNDGKVVITLRLKGDFIRFEATDSGIGIPQSEQKMIFTRFFRASNASVMQPDAFGLGLYLAKNIIEQHQGKIGFKSKEGKGSTFWFEIPIKSAK